MRPTARSTTSPGSYGHCEHASGRETYLAAYTGLRWGELAALTTAQVDTAARTITVDRKVIEVGGHLFTEAPRKPS